jgi:20S proteasome subunit beta 7
MDHFPGTWGRVWTPSHEPVHFVANSTLQPRNDVYGAYNPAYLQTTGPKTHTSSPAVTGTSVIGVKFNGGVVLATDNLGTQPSSIRLGLRDQTPDFLFFIANF